MKAGWEVKTVIDVCTEVTDGSHFSPKSNSIGDYPYITVRDINNDFIDFNNCKFIDSKAYQQLKNNGCKPNNGDLLFSKDGTVGKVSLIDFDKEFVVLSSLAILRPKKNIINSTYFKYVLKNPSFIDEAIGKKTGVAIRRIILKHLKDIQIPLPPLDEQKRIVAILDEAFAAIDRAKANAEKNLANAKELFESYLNGIFANPGEDWEKKNLEEVTTKIGSGATPRGGQKNYKEEGISLVRSMNVHDWEFRERNLAFIDEKQAGELDGVTLQENDILLNITGASVARCCVFPKKHLPARVNQHVSIIRPKIELLNARFLNLLLTSKPYKDQLLYTGEQGATRQAITKAQIKAFIITIPTLKEQQKIVEKLDKLSAETKQLENITFKKISAFDELRKSILKKAFKGEL